LRGIKKKAMGVYYSMTVRCFNCEKPSSILKGNWVMEIIDGDMGKNYYKCEHCKALIMVKEKINPLREMSDKSNWN
jgi:DNA-directed RNA polymerase subunit RPC12/RpoP